MSAKVYCERCDEVFVSQERYDRHMQSCRAGSCGESCIVDAAISRIWKIFRK